YEDLKQTDGDDYTVMKWDSKLIKLKRLKNINKCNDKDFKRLTLELSVSDKKFEHPNVLKVFG
ncbi:5327_t:CDS:2, partial [Racocetra persica]